MSTYGRRDGTGFTTGRKSEVIASDMKFSEETIWPRDPRFANLAAFFTEAL